MSIPLGPLADLVVLDLSECVAGPYATKLLASLGADVIKIEAPDGGDPMRRITSFGTDPEGHDSFSFLYLNTDKRGITLDLTHKAGVELFKRLLGSADIVVESFVPGKLDSLGLSYRELERINPNLILISISNFGQTGPYRDYPMTDLTAQALGGLMNEIGEPDNAPLKLGGYQALYAAGVAAFTAAMTALVGRDLGSPGQHVDVSIFEMVAFTEWHASSYYSYNGQERKRMGRWNQWKILECADGHLGVVGQFPDIKCFAGPALEDERFVAASGRHEHSLAWGEALQSWLADQAKIDLYHEGQAAGIPWGYVADMADLLDSPHYRARSFFKELRHPEAGAGVYAGQPFRVGDLPMGPCAPAPLLGEHNELVYGGLLGLSTEERAALCRAGTI